MLRKSLIRNCVGGIWYSSARASGVNFQACLIDRSSISPFRINNLRTRNDQNFADCDKSSNVLRSLTGFSSIAAPVLLLYEMADAVNHAELKCWRPLRNRPVQRFAKRKPAPRTSSNFLINPSLLVASPTRRLGWRWLWRRCFGGSQGQS